MITPSGIPQKQAKLVEGLAQIVRGHASLTRDLGVIARRKASYDMEPDLVPAREYAHTNERIAELSTEVIQHERAFRRKMIQLRKVLGDG